MNLYTLDKEYLFHLSLVEPKIRAVFHAKETIGVVLPLHGKDFFCPLSLQDFRHQRNNATFFTLSRQENLGTLHFIHMLPLSTKAYLTPLHWESIFETKEQRLRLRQACILASTRTQLCIFQKAYCLYYAVVKSSPLSHQDKFYRQLSFDFLRLEAKAKTLSP